MKKRFALIAAFLVILSLVALSFFVWPDDNQEAENALASGEEAVGTVIRLQIGNPLMTVNGVETAIDESNTSPVSRNNRTLLPIRAVVEAMGGTVTWDNGEATVTLSRGGDVVNLTIGSTTAFYNNTSLNLDTAPIVINGRTFLPIRFIAESFGFYVAWNGENNLVTISDDRLADEGAEDPPQPPAAVEETAGPPLVYMTRDISPEGLMAVYRALGRAASGKVAVKLSLGEPGGHYYLNPDLIKNLVLEVDGTFVDSNVAYGGRRASTALHLQVAEEHGFTYAPVDILDAEGDIGLPVPEGSHLEENLVGSHYRDYDFYLILSHFKGHPMGGFGGAIKNMSVGIASAAGKCLIHSAGASSTTTKGGEQDDFLESMAETAKSIADDLGQQVLYINVMNNLSVDCDCSDDPAEPEMADIGILASLDPVALDQACVDLVFEQAEADGAALVERIESRNGRHTLEHAAAIGLGSRTYRLVSIDD